MSHVPDDLQGRTHRQEFQVQGLSSFPQIRERDMPLQVARGSFPPYVAAPADSPGRINDESRREQRYSTPVSVSAADQEFFDSNHERVLPRHLRIGAREALNGNSSDSGSDQSFQTASTGGSRRESMGRNDEEVMELPREAIHVSQFLEDKTGDFAQERTSDTGHGDSQQYYEPFRVNTSPFSDDPPSVPTPPFLSEEEDDDSHHGPPRGIRIGEPTMLMIQTTSPSYYLVPLRDDTHHPAIHVHHHGGDN